MKIVLNNEEKEILTVKVIFILSIINQRKDKVILKFYTMLILKNGLNM